MPLSTQLKEHLKARPSMPQLPSPTIRNSQETIDVIIPTYNNETYLMRAIHSVEKQSLLPNTIIIVDDGSTDRTREIIQNYKGKLPITYIRKVNAGPSSARNVGIKKSLATYIAFLDADDEWHPQMLESLHKIFKHGAFPSLGLVYCQYDIIDSNSKYTDSHYVFHLDEKIRGNIFHSLLAVNVIASSASGVLIKRECFSNVGYFDERLYNAEDWDMWLRISQRYAVDYANAVLVHIRRHGSNNQNDAYRMFTNRIAFYNMWLQRLPSKSTIPNEWVKYIIYQTLARLPNIDYFRAFYTLFSFNVKKRIYQKVVRTQLGYLCLRLALTPYTIVRNFVIS